MSTLPVAFSRLADLAYSLDVTNINKLDGCWEHQIDDHWFVAINAHEEPMKCSHDVEVPPFNAYIEFNGFPAGMMHPAQGGMIAAGALANEDSFIAAIESAISKAQMVRPF